MVVQLEQEDLREEEEVHLGSQGEGLQEVVVAAAGGVTVVLSELPEGHQDVAVNETLVEAVVVAEDPGEAEMAMLSKVVDVVDTEEDLASSSNR